MAERPIRILVVGSDARVRSALSQTLQLETDLEVVGDAADAAAALATLTSCDCDVIVVDVLIPDDPAGLAVVTALSRLPNCAVVALSVRSTVRPAALAAGAVAFIDMGDDIDELLRAVRTAGMRRR